MWSIPIKKFFAGIRSKRKPSVRKNSFYLNERGQGILEYVLVLVVVLSVVFVAGKPLMAKLQKKFEKGAESGIFKDDPTGAGFYYFPVK